MLQTAGLPPTNPFADLLESSTASATPSDDLDNDLDLSSAAAANNPFLASLAATTTTGVNEASTTTAADTTTNGVNGSAVAVDATSDPWASHNTDGLYFHYFCWHFVVVAVVSIFVAVVIVCPMQCIALDRI